MITPEQWFEFIMFIYDEQRGFGLPNIIEKIVRGENTPQISKDITKLIFEMYNKGL